MAQRSQRDLLKTCSIAKLLDVSVAVLMTILVHYAVRLVQSQVLRLAVIFARHFLKARCVNAVGAGLAVFGREGIQGRLALWLVLKIVESVRILVVAFVLLVDINLFIQVLFEEGLRLPLQLVECDIVVLFGLMYRMSECRALVHPLNSWQGRQGLLILIF